MKVLAVIPARGGSKGVLRKNVANLCGKPLIGWTIEAAKESQHINRIVISTDDTEISEVSRRFGVEVVQRPSELSGDRCSSESALLHTLGELQNRDDYVPDLLVFLQCTSPLTTAEDIDGTIDILMEEQADSALAVADFHYFLWKQSGGESVGINHDKARRQLRQERSPEFLETGAVYVMRTAGFRHAMHRFFGSTAMYLMPAERRLEIDDPIDLQVAEVLLRDGLKRKSRERLPEIVGAVVFDFDGVFTDNRVYVNETGEEAVACNRSDGWGTAELRKSGVEVLVLSTEENPVVSARCSKLSIPCLQGQREKVVALRRWLSEKSVDADNTVYVGNDVNDLDCLQLVGCGIVVADAHPRVFPAAQIVLQNVGGDGAVREVVDMILQHIEEKR